MNPTRSIAPVRLAALALLAFAGCTSVLNAGFQDDAGRMTSSTTAGISAASGSSTGRGSSQGTSSGASSSGSVQGGSSGSASSGGATGGTTGGDAGPCRLFGINCGSNDQCCTGVCNGSCLEALGDQCFGDKDCSSYNCVNEQCACGPAQSHGGQGSCAVDADCCNGDSCSHYLSGGVQYGACCNQIGGACQSATDCCDGNCSDGLCACIPLGSTQFGCPADADCCQGKCVSYGNQGSVCQSGPGSPCTSPADCATGTCIDAGCGSCSVANATCATSGDCCSGLACATTVSGFSTLSYQLCCAGQGAACTAGDSYACCSQVCTNGSCSCGSPGDSCDNDQGCCAGGSCQPSPIFSPFEQLFDCCQKDGQACLSNSECCSDNCATQQCACLADGGYCGVFGKTYYGDQACCSGACSDAGACL